MKAQELRKLSNEDLEKEFLELKDELFMLRFRMTTGQLDNVMRIREVKRNIARIKTIQRQRFLKACPGG